MIPIQRHFRRIKEALFLAGDLAHAFLLEVTQTLNAYGFRLNGKRCSLPYRTCAPCAGDYALDNTVFIVKKVCVILSILIDRQADEIRCKVFPMTVKHLHVTSYRAACPFLLRASAN